MPTAKKQSQPDTKLNQMSSKPTIEQVLGRMLDMPPKPKRAKKSKAKASH